MLEWIAAKPRAYEELIDAWKTSCPRFPIWEDACDDGLVGVEPAAPRMVYLTSKGRQWLEAKPTAETP